MDEENSTNLGLDSANPVFDEEMVNLEDLDLDIELCSLSLDDENKWNATNILDNIETPFNSPVHPTFHPSDLTTKQQQQHLGSSDTSKTHENEDTIIHHNLNRSSSIIVATQNKDQNTNETASIEQESVAATLVHDPSPLLRLSANSSSPPLHSSSSKVGIILERERSSSHQDQEYMSRMSWFNQFPHDMQHENSHRNEGGSMHYQHSISNSPLVPNTMSNYNFQVEARAGIGTGYLSSGQFMTNQRSAFQNNIMDPHTDFNSGRADEHNHFLATNMYDSQYARSYNYMHHDSSSSFSAQLPQDGFAPAPAGMYYNKIYDLNSQNSLRPAPDYSFYPRGNPEPHPAFVQVPPPNHAYNRPILPDPTALPYYGPPPLYSSYHSHHPQPAPYPYPYSYHNNSFGSGSSVQPSTYPPSYDNYNPQTMIPQQIPGSQGVASSDHQMNGYKYNRLLLNTPPAPPERQSYNTMMLPQEALPSGTEAMSWSQQHNIINGSQSQSQALMKSMSVDLFSGTTQGSSSDSNSRDDFDEFTRLLRMIRPESALGNHQEQPVTTPVSLINNETNQVVTRQRGKGKLLQSSTTREPSPAIRRILDMSSTRTVIRNPLPNQTPNYSPYGSNDGWIPDLKKQVMSSSIGNTNPVVIRVEREKRRRGRPRKIQPQLQPHSGSASSSNLGKRGRPSRSAEVDQPPYKQPSSHSIYELLNAVYDPAIENEGSPIDPFLRLFEALPLRII